MKRFCWLLLLLICLCSGCGPRHTDWFAPFGGGFEAEISGTVYGVNFSALWQAEAVNEKGVLPLTVTFYAPETMNGTILARNGEGELSLSFDGVTVTEGLGGFGELLSLFPVSGEVESATVTKAGHTRVEGDGFFLEFLADGTPYAAGTADVTVTVLRWQKK